MKSILLISALTACGAHAAVITGALTVGQSTSVTTGDGLVTLYAYESTTTPTAGTFNAAAGFIGVNSSPGDSGTSGVNDADGDPATTGDQEAIDVAFAPTVGITQIIFAWSRADGPAATDGIQISGFTSDPGATVGEGTFTDLRWDAGSSSIFFELSGPHFTSANRTVDFSNLAASAGQTLRITSNDSDQAAPQAAIRSITYVPEPGSLALLAFSGLALLRRRR